VMSSTVRALLRVRERAERQSNLQSKLFEADRKWQ
jgi:hypothetical protein